MSANLKLGNFSMVDYYSILGVSRGANQDEIKKAFRKLAHQHHPDKKHGDEAKFKEINEAYSILGDPEKRRQYDQFGRTANSQGGSGGFSGQSNGQGFGGFDFGNFGGNGFHHFEGSGFEDIFSDMFMGGGGRGRKHESRGQDVQIEITLSLEEVVRGIEKKISYQRVGRCPQCQGTGGKPGSRETTCSVCDGNGQVRKTLNTLLGAFSQVVMCDTCGGRGKTYTEKCSTCHGAGQANESVSLPVTVPAGISEGETLSVAGQGMAGSMGSQPGDLYVSIRVAADKRFTRTGDDLHSTVRVKYSQLVLGAKIDIETIDGMLAMKIPAGTEPGEVFRIRGKGVPHLRRFGRGDQLVEIKLEVPKKPSGALRSLAEDLAKIGS